MCRTGKVVLLGTVVEVGQGIIVSAFHQEISGFGAEFHAVSARNAAVEPVVYGFVMLFYGQSRVVVPVAAYRIAVS